MKNLRKYGLGFLMAMCCIALVTADTSGDYNVTLTLGNTAPVVLDVGMAAGNTTAKPTQNDVTTVTAKFTATDDNGAGDLNKATANCTLILGAAEISSTSCVDATPVGNSINFTCNISVPFYFLEGKYNVKCEIEDMSEESGDGTESSVGFIYGSLFGVGVTEDTVGFTGLSVGESDTGDKGVVASNEGNVAAVKLSVKAQNLENAATDVFLASSFNATLTDEVGGGVAMVSNTAVDVPDSGIAVGESESKTVYFSVEVPSGQPAGAYSAVSDWVLAAHSSA